MQIRYGLASNSWGKEECEAISHVLASGRLTMGPEVREFECQLAEFHGVKHAVMVNSGSSANLVGAAALTYVREYPDISFRKRGVVIAPAVSWSTTYFPFLQLGYSVVLVDVDKSFNLDIGQLRDALKHYECAGVVSVNLLGVSAANDELRQICDEHNLFLFEDNCESFGARLNGKLCGSFGDVGTLSFFFSHHLQTMEGGAVLTNDDRIAAFSRSLRAHGWVRDGNYDELMEGFVSDEFDRLFKFVLPGYCVRPLEMSGAIGKSQLAKWGRQLKCRTENASLFMRLAKSREFLIVQSGFGEPTWFGFGCLFNVSRDERLALWRFLNAAGIESRPIVAGNFATQPVTRFCDVQSFGELYMAQKIDSSGMFFGNDGVDLAEQIYYLFKMLDDYFLG